MTLSLVLQIAATATTLASMWLIADKRISGPIVGQVSNVFWLLLDFHLGLWGLIPLALAMIVLHARCFLKWRRA